MNYGNYYCPPEDTSKDAEIAQMLQRLENMELSQQAPQVPLSNSLMNSYNPIPNNSYNSIPNYPIANNSLMSSLVLPIEEDKCIICRQTFAVNFYSFPSCAPRSNHNYCEVCAKRLITLNENKNYGAEPSYSISCKYCRSKTELRNIGALENYRKSVQQKSASKEGLFKDGSCPYHDKILIYFCNSCYEPVCASCSSGYHKSHRLEDLDSSYHKIQQQLHAAKASLEFKRAKIDQNVQTLLDSREAVGKQAETARIKVNNEIDQLISLLQSKKVQFQQRITEMEDTKKNEIDTALQNSAKSIEDINESIEFVAVHSQKVGYLQNPLEFFQLVGGKGKDYISSLSNRSVPFVPPSYHFPDVSTHQVRKDINNLKYPY